MYSANLCRSPQSLRQFLRLSPPRSRQRTLSSKYQQIDLVHRIAKQCPQLLKLSSPDDVWANFAISSLIDVDGMHQIGNSASILHMHYDLAIVMPTAQPPKYPVNNDLSPAGQAIVRVKMNGLGMR
ncbi:dipeptidase [Paracoccidioides lutzii Pb01]|uniref:Dipeptidase n=1 Tax=Paracoccidioides lutzii (strain ATCC MYA-826 / Pb01) TaxID=502779 RepID=C1H0L8_PARBA|nr:dipeptidase [Paracoccidioides lutzii Pb01]EEH33259.2 dipeptidase [Paracoccidioides lutzii Pb01]